MTTLERLLADAESLINDARQMAGGVPRQELRLVLLRTADHLQDAIKPPLDKYVIEDMVRVERRCASLAATIESARAATAANELRSSSIPPRLPTGLEMCLLFLLSNHALEHLGQLEEDFPKRVRQMGNARLANRWFYKEVALMIAPLLWRRARNLGAAGWVAKGVSWLREGLLG